MLSGKPGSAEVYLMELLQLLPNPFCICQHCQTSIQIGISWNTGIICASISLSTVLQVGYKHLSGLFGKFVECLSEVTSSFSHQVTPKFSQTCMYLALLLELSLAQSNRMGQLFPESQKTKRHLCHADAEVWSTKNPFTALPLPSVWFLHTVTKVIVKQSLCRC